MLYHVIAVEAHGVNAIKQRMECVRVVGVTCLGINHPLLANKKFDICIMDEAAQITLPVCFLLSVSMLPMLSRVAIKLSLLCIMLFKW